MCHVSGESVMCTVDLPAWSSGGLSLKTCKDHVDTAISCYNIRSCCQMLQQRDYRKLHKTSFFQLFLRKQTAVHRLLRNSKFNSRYFLYNTLTTNLPRKMTKYIHGLRCFTVIATLHCDNDNLSCTLWPLRII